RKQQIRRNPRRNPTNAMKTNKASQIHRVQTGAWLPDKPFCFTTINHMKSINERNKIKSINETPTLRWLGQVAQPALPTNRIILGALALLLLVLQASAASFSFSTGDPDGKIATLSRASS